ncbi:MAG: dihydrolipoamide acetyltransferase family protein [Candidatus Manganitrophus sp.]|nr:dihydrolipoamide acetyltransferase family protein [Candidatus Manganitrophus sp.]
MADFLMPILGADMVSATLVEWKKKPGDPVKKGEILAEVETDKGVIEVENFTDGVLEKILVETGTEVPVGTPLAIIREAGAPAAPISTAIPRPVPPRPKIISPVIPPTIRLSETGRIRISPLARKRAESLGVDLMKVKGTGPGGAITREDVEQAAAGKPAVEKASVDGTFGLPPLDRTARMRQAIAAAMARSKREIPHYYLQTTVDMHRAMTWLTEENQKRSLPDRLLYGVLLIKAVALALREVPELNAVWKEGKVVQSEAIHIGVAISLRQGGLVAPALHNPDRLDLDTLMRQFRDLVQRARSGSLRSSEFSDPTITITSLGEQGVEGIYPIIYPPQVAIVGFGKIVERPWVVEGKVIPRPVITASLAGDHRVTDGHRGGLFLAAVDRLLQEPRRL